MLCFFRKTRKIEKRSLSLSEPSSMRAISKRVCFFLSAGATQTICKWEWAIKIAFGAEWERLLFSDELCERERWKMKNFSNFNFPSRCSASESDSRRSLSLKFKFKINCYFICCLCRHSLSSLSPSFSWRRTKKFPNFYRA